MRRKGGPQGRPTIRSLTPFPVVSATALPLLVLDTNVVLDWLLFSDPRAAPLAAAVTSGRARWIASVPMRAELDRVLRRGIAARPGHGTDAVVAAFDRWAISVDTPTAPSPFAIRCADDDDQKFVDLALQMRASALISRDHAVLRLARAAAPHGLQIVVPERWVG
jgi:predicted nucleic acid-binding protein